MRKLAVLVFLAIISLADSAGAFGIPGAAGNVEFWYGLSATPQRQLLFIVTHDSWGPFGSGRNTALSQRGARIGVEWWVLADGTIIHSDAERITGHCGGSSTPGIGNNCNELSVGIEFEGYLQHTEAQVRSGLALIRFLQERYCLGSERIHAHRKAGNGAEGVAMEQAGRSLGYQPGCSGNEITGDIPGTLIARAASVENPPLSQLYGPGGFMSGQPYALSHGSQFSTPLGNSQNIMGAFTPTAGVAPFSYSIPISSSGPSVSSIINSVAYPDVHGHEEDAASRASAEAAKNMKIPETIIIIPPSATTSKSLQGITGATTTPTLPAELVYTQPATTFFDRQPVRATGTATSSVVSAQLNTILTGLLSAILSLFRISIQ